MHYQPSEIVNLTVALFLTPAMWVGFRDVTLPGKRYFILGYAAMVLAFVFTIVEQDGSFPYFALFNSLEHVSLAVAAVLFAHGAYRMWLSMRSDGGGFR